MIKEKFHFPEEEHSDATGTDPEYGFLAHTEPRYSAFADPECTQVCSNVKRQIVSLI
jgi:hypothetical protein